MGLIYQTPQKILKILGSNKFDPYIKIATLYERVLNFELWFLVFRFKFLVEGVYFYES